MPDAISPADARARLRRKGEVALLDLRERGVHASGHPLLAASAPLSRLELDIARLVPRRGSPLIVLDDGDGDDRAARGAERLSTLGYTDVVVLAGGAGAWHAAGYGLFDGIHVPSKAFGEVVEQRCRTPRITADALAGLHIAGARLVILDSRPLGEYRRMSIPGAIDVPGAELVHRIRDLAPDPETLVVVNCAGRTRSIIGAQSLIDAGVPNPVAALENGTMGWTLAGHALEHGADRLPAPPSPAARAWAREAAARVAARHRVPSVERDTLARWRDEVDARTLYLCDVRTPEEYEAGHLPGARSTPGGQLVQATDAFVPVHNARVVLVDDDGVRATMTASWLIQMGRATHVLAGGLGEDALETGPEPCPVLGLDPARRRREIDAAQLRGLLGAGEVTLLDLADSRRYEQGHVDGAWWAVRARLPETAARLPRESLVTTSPDSLLAHLAAPELERLCGSPVKVLAGGTDAWGAAGLPLASGAERMLGARDDLWLAPYDHPADQVEAAMRAYLAWETALVPRVAREGVRFAVRSRDPEIAP